MAGDDEDSANTCVVCFKEAEIFSVGECDHPVCFECSTRMRVLCQQTECPICRQDMPKVVFAEEVRPFKKQQHKTFDKKYKIAFINPSVEEAFRKLLEHTCKICPDVPEYRTFNALKDHMRREHERFYCDLCVENLKIFSSERRSYSRQELAQHRRKGDPDDRSHRGHPLCEFCDQRFVDSDELFRHLRRIHLYCHFCDADGYHRYFGSYDYLREHFRADHFLCEEGECKEEKFTSVFRSDIDLKAHRASIHGRALGKAATKQARTLELEFTLAPRPRGSGGGYSHGHGHRRERHNEENEGAVGYTEPTPEVTPAKPNLQEDFPTLSGAAAPPPAASGLIHFNSRGGRLNMSEEHFPALSSGEQGSNVNISLQRGPPAQRSSNNFSIKVQHKRRQETSVAPSPQSKPPLRGLSDFPSLGAPAKAPVASSWKGKVVPKGNVVGKIVPQAVSSPYMQPSFAQVPKSSSNMVGGPAIDGKSKVTVGPPSVVIPPETEESKSPSKSSKKKKNKGRQSSTSPLPQSSSASSIPSGASSATSGAKSKKKEDRKCSELKIGALQEDSSAPSTPVSTAVSSSAFGPPPGFSKSNSTDEVQMPVSPPPGFSVTLNSVARPANGLTFTNSCGESFAISQTAGVFIQPVNSKDRNSSLVQRIQNLQREPEGFNKFCQMSSKFRRGEVKAVDYYNHCKESVGAKAFASVFPEILVLLPDIRKQQELWLAHQRRGDFVECVTCGQVLSSLDKRTHEQSHVMNNNFPSLTPKEATPKAPKWTVSRK